jgi:hypothetical protein
MTARTDEPEVEPRLPPPERPGLPAGPGTGLRVLTSLAGIVAAFVVLWAALGYLRDEDANRLTVILVAIVVGVKEWDADSIATSGTRITATLLSH